jgi:hypothetical protein
MPIDMDPLHEIYASANNCATIFVEATSHLKDMRRFLKVFLMAEEKYMPLGPPLSPLTKSFFMTWALFDLQFNNKNNVAFYVNKASKRLELSEEQVDALNKLSESRMGVYEHLGTAGRYVRLRELVTETWQRSSNWEPPRGAWRRFSLIEKGATATRPTLSL